MVEKIHIMPSHPEMGTSIIMKLPYEYETPKYHDSGLYIYIYVYIYIYTQYHIVLYYIYIA